MKARPSSTTPASITDEKEGSRGAQETDPKDQVQPTPLLIVLGVIVLLTGILSGILMSQATFVR